MADDPSLVISDARLAAMANARKNDQDQTEHYEGLLSQLDDHVEKVITQLDHNATQLSPKKSSELKMVTAACESVVGVWLVFQAMSSSTRLFCSRVSRTQGGAARAGQAGVRRLAREARHRGNRDGKGEPTSWPRKCPTQMSLNFHLLTRRCTQRADLS